MSSLVKPHLLVVPTSAAGERLDSYLAACPELGMSRSRVTRLIGEGCVTLNGDPCRPAQRLQGGERVEVILPPPEVLELEPEAIALDIVHADEDVIVVNKPRGMVVHPSPGHRSSTLVNALLHLCPDLAEVGDRQRPGIVHRLDRDTTGLLVAAKRETAYRSLADQLRARTAGREYVALVRGEVLDDQGIICAPLGRHPADRMRFAVLQPGKGKEAITRFRVVERFPGFTLLHLSLDTGRTHQIRVHMAHLGHPVVGDPLYGRGTRRLMEEHRLPRLKGQALHAFRLSFTHPRTGERMTFEAPLPADFEHLLEALRAAGRRPVEFP